MWGWSGLDHQVPRGVQVLPTRVGMVREHDYITPTYWRSPHACGDGPRSISIHRAIISFSPRVWGWSAFIRLADLCFEVLPTRVGMVRMATSASTMSPRSPHACGDGPIILVYLLGLMRFSPRVWGWSDIRECFGKFRRVLPTRVGMVRKKCSNLTSSHRSPHACGDGPESVNANFIAPVFSPRVWGWSGTEIMARSA